MFNPNKINNQIIKNHNKKMNIMSKYDHIKYSKEHKKNMEKSNK